MADSRPNIILITTDQQRGDCIGIDPNSPDALQTPNLDWIGRSGTFFRRGYSECPSCIPARRCLMTGTAPATNGMVGYQEGIPFNPAHTMAGELSKAGYQTEMVGKLHLHPLHKRYGFDHMQLADATRGEGNDYIDWLRQTHGRNEIHPGMAHGISSNGWVGRPHHLSEEQMHTFWCVNQAMEFLDRRDPEAPFFLNISMIDPHPPLTPPAHYYDRYVSRDLPTPPIGDWADDLGGPQRGLNPIAAQINIPKDDMHCAQAAYYGMVNFIDDQIGRLYQFAPKIFNDAYVIFTSDHGDMMGDHHLFRKTLPYEGSARVPFLIKPPESLSHHNVKSIPEGSTCDTPVAWQDIMPTVLDAAGIEVPDSCTGKSLLPITRGESSSVREVLHGEHAKCYEGDFASHFLTDGQMKYIWFSGSGREQLFDLSCDPNELHNITSDTNGEEQVSPWRNRLVDILEKRPEGFVEAEKLIAGRDHEAVMPGYDPDNYFDFM
jgi:arylsulfatase